MLNVRVGLVAAFLLSATPAAADPDPPIKVRQLVRNPDWSHKPTASDILRHYPKDALRRHVAGRAVIACEVALSERLENCSIHEEIPQGEGFGVAALAVAEYARMKPMTVDGEPRAGASIRLPITFSLP